MSNQRSTSLIATPGRLIDHLDSTPGFTLAHLRFLVIDEADRLLNQSFQEWLGRVLAATEGMQGAEAVATQRTTAQAPYELLSYSASGLGAAAWSTLQEEAVPSVQKLLFSATLTRDPAKIARPRPSQPTLRHSSGQSLRRRQDDQRRNGAQQSSASRFRTRCVNTPFVTTSADKPFTCLPPSSARHRAQRQPHPQGTLLHKVGGFCGKAGEVDRDLRRGPKRERSHPTRK